MVDQLIDDKPVGQDITPEKLLEAGYKEFPLSYLDKCDRNFQRSIRDDKGKRLYFVTIRLWTHLHWISWDCLMCTDSDTDGYLWATIRENTIQGMESRAEALWKAAGAKAYDDE